MFEDKKVLTGVKPTGTPHLGNYLGAIKPAIRLGHQALDAGGKHYMFIADYHAINAEKDPAVLNQKLKEIACIYLAAGLDPSRSVFYRQSDIAEIPEITTILYAYTPKGFMNKAHAYKAAVDRNREAGKPDDDGINMGLYTYPTLMAADILAYDTDIVPVGKDQVQHVEIARDIAGAINAHYNKQLLVLPEYSIDENVAVVPGIDGRKMSKSYGNSIMLGATAEETAKLIKKSPTDSERRITFDPVARPQVSALLTTAGLGTGRDPKDIAEEIGDSGAGALKAYVIESVNEFLAPHRERRAELAKDMDSIRDILHDGNKRANAIAEETLDQVREAMGMKY